MAKSKVFIDGEGRVVIVLADEVRSGDGVSFRAVEVEEVDAVEGLSGVV